MTKKTFHYITEAGWLLLALMPIILYMIAARNTGGETMLTFSEMMSEKLQFFTDGNIIYTTVAETFGSSGVLPILTDSLTAYASYYISIEILHLIVDVLLFIPRLAHEWMTAFTKKNS